MTEIEFRSAFEKRFGDAAWMVGFGTDSHSIAGEIEFVSEDGEGMTTFHIWPTDYKDFLFKVNPKNVTMKPDQWEMLNILDGSRWAVRNLRPDQEAQRG